MTRKKKLSFYLVGGIQFVDDYMSWRQKMADFLDELGQDADFPWGEVYHGKWMKGEFKKWLKTMDKNDWIARVRKYMRSQVIKFDLKTLLKADGLIFYLPKGTKTVGSYGEQTLAYFLKKFNNKKKLYKGERIFVIVEEEPDKLSYWLIGCSDRIFWSMEEFETYFRKNFNRRIKKKKR